MKKLLLIGISLGLIALYGMANASYDPSLQNRIQFNTMLNTYPELRDVNIRFVPAFAEKLMVCEIVGDKKCSVRISSYELGNDTSYIQKNIIPFSLQYNVMHETGHHVYFAVMEQWQRDKWVRLWNDHPNHVSPYSKHSPWESFAEWFAVYKYNLRDINQYGTYAGVEMVFDSPQGKFMDTIFPKYRRPNYIIK